MSPQQTSQQAAARVTIVTQTRVRSSSSTPSPAGRTETSKVIQSFPGFIEQTVIPPSPPQQVDWVILQRFATEAMPSAWLNSPERLKRMEGAGADAGGQRRRPYRQGRRARARCRPPSPP